MNGKAVGLPYSEAGDNITISRMSGFNMYPSIDIVIGDGVTTFKTVDT